MKIFIDINHPAHVHYFRRFINKMSENGHEFVVVARDLKIIQELLEYYKIVYINRNKRPKGFFLKLFYLLSTTFHDVSIAMKLKPDLFISIGSFWVGISAKILRKPYIALDDTQHNQLNHLLYKNFANVIITPHFFPKIISKKQIHIKSYFELFYLHSNCVLDDITFTDSTFDVLHEENYILMRFISWDATHDYGANGIDILKKRMMVEELSKYGKVYISSEEKIDDSLLEYQLKIPPYLIHHVMSKARLMISEGATMAAEAALLGVPTIYISGIEVGNCRELEEKYHLLFNIREFDHALKKAVEIASTNDSANWKKKRQVVLTENIDITKYLIDFVQNYSDS